MPGMWNYTGALPFHGSTWFHGSPNMCWGNFSLKLGQLDPRHEKSIRCLSIILATILLSSNPKWPPSAMKKISEFFILSLTTCVIPLM